MQITETLTRVIASLAITVLLNGALIAAFNNIVAHAEIARHAARLVG